MDRDEENPIVSGEDITKPDYGITMHKMEKEDILDKDKTPKEWITDKQIEEILYGKPRMGIVAALSFLLIL